MKKLEQGFRDAVGTAEILPHIHLSWFKSNMTDPKTGKKTAYDQALEIRKKILKNDSLNPIVTEDALLNFFKQNGTRGYEAVLNYQTDAFKADLNNSLNTSHNKVKTGDILPGIPYSWENDGNNEHQKAYREAYKLKKFKADKREITLDQDIPESTLSWWLKSLGEHNSNKLYGTLIKYLPNDIKINIGFENSHPKFVATKVPTNHGLTNTDLTSSKKQFDKIPYHTEKTEVKKGDILPGIPYSWEHSANWQEKEAFEQAAQLRSYKEKRNEITKDQKVTEDTLCAWFIKYGIDNSQKKYGALMNKLPESTKEPLGLSTIQNDKPVPHTQLPSPAEIVTKAESNSAPHIEAIIQIDPALTFKENQENIKNRLAQLGENERAAFITTMATLYPEEAEIVAIIGLVEDFYFNQ